MAETDNKKKDLESGCTCRDEFQTRPCPVHFDQEELENAPAFIDDKLILNEGNMMRWEGFSFTCPRCEEKSIMHLFNYCPSCGSKILVQSKKVTEFIRNLTGK